VLGEDTQRTVKERIVAGEIVVSWHCKKWPPDLKGSRGEWNGADRESCGLGNMGTGLDFLLEHERVKPPLEGIPVLLSFKLCLVL